MQESVESGVPVDCVATPEILKRSSSRTTPFMMGRDY